MLASVAQQLGIEAYIARSSLWQRFHIANFVLFAPDIDLDVAYSKMFPIASDPDLPFGNRAEPYARVTAQGPVRLTVYSSPNDRALSLSAFLFGSALRLGQLAARTEAQDYSGLAGLGEITRTTGGGDFIEVEGGAGFIGHSYFLSNPSVQRDLAALICDRLEAGNPGRQLVEIKRPFWRIDTTSQLGQRPGAQF